MKNKIKCIDWFINLYQFKSEHAQVTGQLHQNQMSVTIILASNWLEIK